MERTTDTIAAVATPAGPGAIGILRLSGPEAVSAASAAFRASDGRPLEAHPPRRLIYGDLLDREGAVIDKVLATYTRGPASYTGEDTAELHCHGAPMVLSLGLESLFSHGARQAGPGEFTRRAFLNGRLDLVQAEAVGDLLEASSWEGARHAAGQLSGALSRRIGGIYSALVDVMAHFHAVLDYPDEDIDPFRESELEVVLSRQAAQLRALLATCRRGSQILHGLRCAIVGRPNAGKSSLLNALLGYERAIVTEIPGTTRDTVEETVTVGGTLLRLIDTAGLRDTPDRVEQMGVERSRAAMESAELILVLWDSSSPVTQEDGELLSQAMSLAPTVLVRSKSDLLSAPLPLLSLDPMPPVVELSARTGQGLEELEQAIRSALPRQTGEEAYGELLTNARQEEAASRALERLEGAQAGLSAGVTPDALLTDVEEALSALGELTGASVREDITDRIFQRFCVGK